MRAALMILWAAALALPPARFAEAQSYPARPIRLLVPYPPGGSFDIFARVVAQKLSVAFDRQVVVDNRGGASGIIAMDLGAHAAPDGYTLVFGGAGTLSIQPVMHAKLPYDPIKDFSPVSMVATAPHVLVTSPALPVRNVKDLIALAKDRPGQLNYASGGNGGPPHLAAELFKSMTGTDLVHVPYTGGAQATTGTVSGQVQVYFSSMASAIPLIKDGRLRALGVTSSKRTAAAPDVPTIAEAGVPGYELLVWFAVVAPDGTPRAAVARLNAEIAKAVAAPDARKRFLDLATDPAASTPAELGAFIRSELAKWGKLIKQLGIRPE